MRSDEVLQEVEQGLAAADSPEAEVAELMKARGQCGATALIIAAKERRLDVIERLLERHPEEQLAAGDEWGTTALVWAVDGDTPPISVDCVKALLGHIPEEQLHMVSSSGWTLLIHSANKLVEVVKELLRYIPEEQLHAAHFRDETALMHAAETGADENIREMLKYKPEEQLRARDTDGWTALPYAAYFGQPACIAELLQHIPEEQLRSTCDGGTTAFMMASERGHLLCVKALLNHIPEEQLAAEGSGGWTALSLAAYFGQRDSVRVLLLAGSPPCVPVAASKDGARAVINEVAMDLIQHTAALEALRQVAMGDGGSGDGSRKIRRRNGKLANAARKGDRDAVRTLLLAKARPCVKVDSGNARAVINEVVAGLFQQAASTEAQQQAVIDFSKAYVDAKRNSSGGGGGQ